MAASVSLRSESSSSRPRLPEGWSVPESVEDVIVADGLSIRRAGISSVAPDGEEITGSAAALELIRSRSAAREPEHTAAAARASFELLERASIVHAIGAGSAHYELRAAGGTLVKTVSRSTLFPESEDPSRWRHARSNGVAIHSSWRNACERALWELAERDRVLAAWHGHVRPERIDGGPLGLGAKTASYEWSAWSFPEEWPGSFSQGLAVVGVFGFPTSPDLPLALGFAARPQLRAALADATQEAVQLLGFLWGEPVAVGIGDVPPTAFGHLDFYQPSERHHLLRSWLAGEHLQYGHLDAPARRDGEKSDAQHVGTHHAGGESVSQCDVVLYADLTPPWLEDGFRVVKAVCSSARPLTFGHAPFGAHLPEERRIHPIS
jgi:YcaO cyclodehydratase, ATP-ad Mg2+-binding